MVKSVAFIALAMAVVGWANYSFTTPQTPPQTTESIFGKELAFAVTAGIQLVQNTGHYHIILNITIINNSTNDLHVRRSVAVLRSITLPNSYSQQLNQQQSDESSLTLKSGGAYTGTVTFDVDIRPTTAEVNFYVYLQEREEPIWTVFTIKF